MYIIYVWNVWISRKIEYPKLRIFNCKLYTLYMYRKSGFQEKLNDLYCVNWTVNCTHNMNEILDLQKIWISKTTIIQREIVCIIYVRNLWICRKIEYTKLQKYNGKLCTLYVRNVWISKKIEYRELRIFNVKLCTLYMYGMTRFAEKLNVQNCVNWAGNCLD